MTYTLAERFRHKYMERDLWRGGRAGFLEGFRKQVSR